MAAYYNENDPYAAQWLRNLVAGGHIAHGHVDERSIVDVSASDLDGYAQCHWFAGIGGWSLALRLAGWPDARPVWTGSCPCQPFSAAGQGKAGDDERHLWPAWFSLIRQLRPPVVFGEQVEAAIGWGWLDLVCADMEQEGYAIGAAVLPACSVGAPHIRQRVWFVADAGRGSDECRCGPGEARGAAGSSEGEARQREWSRPAAGAGRASGLLANASGIDLAARSMEERCSLVAPEQGRAEHRGAGLLADASKPGLERRQRGEQGQRLGGGRLPVAGYDADHAWRDLAWLPCTDGKARPTQPGIFPLAHRVPARVGRLRAYGNAVVPQVAAEFIRAAQRSSPEAGPTAT